MAITNNKNRSMRNKRRGGTGRDKLTSYTNAIRNPRVGFSRPDDGPIAGYSGQDQNVNQAVGRVVGAAATGDPTRIQNATANLQAVAAANPGATNVPVPANVNPQTGAPTTGGSGGAGGTGGARSGFGQSIAEAGYPEAWDNPDVLLNLLFQQRGWDPNSGAFGMGLQSAEAAPLLWMLSQGQDTAQGYGSYLDYFDKFTRGQLTPGGASYGPQDIANMIFGVAGDENSPLRNYLLNPEMAPSDQVGTLLSTFNQGLETTMPDVMRAAVMARLNQQGRDWQASALTNPTGVDPFLQDLINQGAGGMFGRR